MKIKFDAKTIEISKTFLLLRREKCSSKRSDLEQGSCWTLWAITEGISTQQPRNEPKLLSSDTDC